MVSKIAITISGAVSLGTFEAGALWEILNAFSIHNQNNPPGGGRFPQIEVDVLSGASAGGMSCAMVANKLAYDADALTDPINNPLYKSWVTDANILKMLPSDAPLYSILSSDYITSIAKNSILSRYDKNGQPLTPAKRHPVAADNISLGLALSNLTGVDYSVPLLSGGSFVYSDFADQFQLNNIDVTQENGPDWQEVAQAAVACGAFPFAFKVQELQRTAADYPDAVLPKTGGNFAFTDGGVFQNEPLGLAINMAQAIDAKAGVLTNDRFYLYIAPGPKSSTLGKTFAASDATFVRLGIRLIECIFNQSRFHDWVQAQAINDQIQQLQSLAQAIEPTLVPANGLPNKPMESLRSAINNPPAAADPANVATISKMVKASGLENPADGSIKDYLYIYGVTAAEQELQGGDFLAFKGFLKESFRQHDYAVGRLKAQELLRSLAANPAGLILDPAALPSDANTTALQNFIQAQPDTLTVSEGSDLIRRFSTVVENIENWVLGDLEKSFSGLVANKLLQELILHAEGNA